MQSSPHKHTIKKRGLAEHPIFITIIVLVVISSLLYIGLNFSEIYCRIFGDSNDEFCASFYSVECSLAFDDAIELGQWSGDSKDMHLEIDGGKLCNSGGNQSFFYSCPHGHSISNFVVILSGISIEELSDGNSGFGYWFHTDNGTNGYQLSYNTKWNVLSFYKFVEGNRISLERKTVPSSWANQALNFKVVVQDYTFEAYKDGELILQVTDDAFDEGLHGFFNEPDSITCIDSITLQKYP